MTGVTIEFDIDRSVLVRKLGVLAPALDDAIKNGFQAVQISIADHARNSTLFTDRTGALRASIRPAELVGKFSSGTLAAFVRVGGRGPGGAVNYAAAVHEGTKPHVIKAKDAQALRIPTGGGFFFRKSVRHPGTAPRAFMTEAADAVAPTIPTTIRAYIAGAIRRSGL